MFKKYPKIYRLGHEDTDGILLGECHVQEKVDGANASIWLEDGTINTGSRTRNVSNEGFNGLTEYAKGNEAIQRVLKDNPTWRLYGEWLVRHTITYSETAYKKFYVFDIFYDEIWDDESETYKGKRFDPEELDKIAELYNLNSVKYHGKFLNPTLEQLEAFCGISVLGEKGEGVVIKNMDFINKFGHQRYAKLVTQTFKESNALVFGGNNKHSDTYHEMWVVNSFMTMPRIQKVMHNLEALTGERSGLTHTSRVASTAYHDLLTEEIWSIQKKCPAINFKALKNLCCKKAVQIYHDILHDNISIADQEK